VTLITLAPDQRAGQNERLSNENGDKTTVRREPKIRLQRPSQYRARAGRISWETLDRRIEDKTILPDARDARDNPLFDARRLPELRQLFDQTINTPTIVC
jgi:hypothetical protein